MAGHPPGKRKKWRTQRTRKGLCLDCANECGEYARCEACRAVRQWRKKRDRKRRREQ